MSFDTNNNPCSKKQRSLIENLCIGRRMSYPSLLAYARDIAVRDIKDIGELTVTEASELIDYLERK